MISAVGPEMHYTLKKLPLKWKREICLSKGQKSYAVPIFNYFKEGLNFQHLKFPDEFN